MEEIILLDDSDEDEPCVVMARGPHTSSSQPEVISLSDSVTSYQQRSNTNRLLPHDHRSVPQKSDHINMISNTSSSWRQSTDIAARHQLDRVNNSALSRNRQPSDGVDAASVSAVTSLLPSPFVNRQHGRGANIQPERSRPHQTNLGPGHFGARQPSVGIENVPDPNRIWHQSESTALRPHSSGIPVQVPVLPLRDEALIQSRLSSMNSPPQSDVIEIPAPEHRHAAVIFSESRRTEPTVEDVAVHPPRAKQNQKRNARKRKSSETIKISISGNAVDKGKNMNISISMMPDKDLSENHKQNKSHLASSSVVTTSGSRRNTIVSIVDSPTDEEADTSLQEEEEDDDDEEEEEANVVDCDEAVVNRPCSAASAKGHSSINTSRRGKKRRRSRSTSSTSSSASITLLSSTLRTENNSENKSTSTSNQPMQSETLSTSERAAMEMRAAWAAENQRTDRDERSSSSSRAAVSTGELIHTPQDSLSTSERALLQQGLLGHSRKAAALERRLCAASAERIDPVRAGDIKILNTTSLADDLSIIRQLVAGEKPIQLSGADVQVSSSTGVRIQPERKKLYKRAAEPDGEQPRNKSISKGAWVSQGASTSLKNSCELPEDDSLLEAAASSETESQPEVLSHSRILYAAPVCSDPVVKIVSTTEDEKERAGPSGVGRPEASRCSDVNVQDTVAAVIRAIRILLPSSEYESVSKKLRKYMNCVAVEYQHSAHIDRFIAARLARLNADPKNVYLHIRDVLDELRKCRAEGRGETISEVSDAGPSRQVAVPVHDAGQAKKRIMLTSITSNPVQQEIRKCDMPGNVAAERGLGEQQPVSTTSAEPRRPVSRHHLRKLEKALEMCGKKIRELENREIDFDKEDDDTYVLQSKYKKRFMEIYRKLAEYKQLSADLERRSDKHFRFYGSRYPEINRRVEKFINRSKMFPDFIDVRKQVEQVNRAKDLHLSAAQVHSEAEKIFLSIGKELKQRQDGDAFESICSYLQDPTTEDPAAADPELARRLDEQGRVARQRMEAVFDQFAEQEVRKDKRDAQEMKEEEEDDCKEEEEQQNDEDEAIEEEDEKIEDEEDISENDEDEVSEDEDSEDEESEDEAEEEDEEIDENSGACDLEDDRMYSDPDYEVDDEEAEEGNGRFANDDEEKYRNEEKGENYQHSEDGLEWYRRAEEGWVNCQEAEEGGVEKAFSEINADEVKESLTEANQDEEMKGHTDELTAVGGQPIADQQADIIYKQPHEEKEEEDVILCSD